MDKKAISTTSAPAAVGAYSQAIAVEGWLYCSGQVALDPATGDLLSSTIAEETKRCLDNLAAVLAEAGSSWDKVVKVTAFLTNMDDFAEFNEMYGTYVGEVPPARATVAVAGLPKGARVEIECVARV